jgi:hypothetical protein
MEQANMKCYTKPLVSSIAVACGVASAGWAGHEEDDEQEIPFDEAFIFFELNDTDGDLGIHGKLDGDAWAWLQIAGPDERRLMVLRNGGRLLRQGLTELFFESAEPTFDELSPDSFFRRFPEGTYEVEGRTLEGDALDSDVEVTHTMPAPAVAYVNGISMAVQCDPEEPGYDAPQVGPQVTISWLPVMWSHPDPAGGGAGVQPPVPVTIRNYEVAVEAEIEVAGESFTATFNSVLPPGQTSMTVPTEFLGLSDTFKYEVLARAESYNQTAVESCFVLAP